MSVQQRGNGTWLVRFKDETGRCRGKTFQSNEKRIAQDFDAEMKRRRRHGELILPSDRTLSQLRDEWLDSRKGRELAPKTREIYDGVWSKYIEPKLGQARIRELDPLTIEQVILDMEKRGVGHATIVKTLTVLSRLFRHAVKHRLVKENPVSYVDRPKATPSKIVVPLTVEQIESVRAELGARDALMVSVLALTGIRPGELLHLRWKHLKDDGLHIEGAVSLGEERSTKTGEPRIVRLLGVVRQEMLEYKLSSGRPSDRELIFPRAKDGRPWSSQDWRNWRQRNFANAVEKAGLPATTHPYALRHTAASTSLRAGRSIVYVARQLGHSPTTLLERYAHEIDEYEDSGPIDVEALVLEARDLSSVVESA